MIKLIYYVYRKLNDIPCRSEVSDVLLSGKRLNTDIRKVAEGYAMGFNLEIIARNNHITRERARQYLFKAVRK
jgi:protein tyrosine/serine phosphatase